MDAFVRDATAAGLRLESRTAFGFASIKLLQDSCQLLNKSPYLF